MTKLTDSAEKYTLPPWRMNQIIIEVLSVLSEKEYYREDFDYKEMIQAMGIKIKSFSSFSPENLKAFRQISLSLWNEGVCLVFPNEETGDMCRMIAYDDTRSAAEIMQIILHEFAHLHLKHTEQSINGETEAACFAVAMSLMLMLEKQFHIGKMIQKMGEINYLLQSIKESISAKEAV